MFLQFVIKTHSTLLNNIIILINYQLINSRVNLIITGQCPQVVYVMYIRDTPIVYSAQFGVDSAGNQDRDGAYHPCLSGAQEEERSEDTGTKWNTTIYTQRHESS